MKDTFALTAAEGEAAGSATEGIVECDGEAVIEGEDATDSEGDGAAESAVEGDGDIAAEGVGDVEVIERTDDYQKVYKITVEVTHRSLGLIS